MNNHALRPTDQADAEVWDAAASVPDPEIPVISIAELGILRAARFEDGVAIVTITPTYSGCPAMDHITRDVNEALKKAGFPNGRVDLVLTPAWTTDWITEEGKEKMREYGIAPPSHSKAAEASGPISLTLTRRPRVTCPRCGSTNTKLLAPFGATSCKSLYSCNDCLEPFEYFKVY